MIKLLGNCSNKGNYEYSEDDVRKIFVILEKELRMPRVSLSKAPK